MPSSRSGSISLLRADLLTESIQMVLIDNLLVALSDLADQEFQRRAWLASEGPEVSSFSELICQVFDDTGLSDALGADRRPIALSERSFSALRKLDWAVSKVDQGLSTELLLEDAQMEAVRRVAASAFESIKLDQSGA